MATQSVEIMDSASLVNGKDLITKLTKMHLKRIMKQAGAELCQA